MKCRVNHPGLHCLLKYSFMSGLIRIIADPNPISMDVHEIMNTSGLLQEIRTVNGMGLTSTLQETRGP